MKGRIPGARLSLVAGGRPMVDGWAAQPDARKFQFIDPPGSVVGRRVLVVEDDPPLMALVGYILRRGGFRVELASNGPSCLALLEGLAFDVLILDEMMPGMDGYDVLRRIRADARHDRMPVALFSTTPWARRSAAMSGFDGCIMKPFLPGEMVDEVRRLLARGRPA